MNKKKAMTCRKENLSKHITENGSEQPILLSFFNLLIPENTNEREREREYLREYLEIEKLEDVNGK